MTKDELLRAMDAHGAAPFVATDMAANFITRLIGGEYGGVAPAQPKEAVSGLLSNDAGGKPRPLTEAEQKINQDAEKFHRLQGRGTHELRNDALADYLMFLADGYADGPHTEGYYGKARTILVDACKWVVSELDRKTNDERVLAVKLNKLREAALSSAQPQSEEFNSEVLGRVITYLSQFDEFKSHGNNSADQAFRNIVECIDRLRGAQPQPELTDERKPPQISEDDAIVHIFPSDLARMAEGETTASVFSVAVGCPEERSVPLYTADQVRALLSAKDKE